MDEDDDDDYEAEEPKELQEEYRNDPEVIISRQFRSKRSFIKKISRRAS